MLLVIIEVGEFSLFVLSYTYGMLCERKPERGLAASRQKKSQVQAPTRLNTLSPHLLITLLVVSLVLLVYTGPSKEK